MKRYEGNVDMTAGISNQLPVLSVIGLGKLGSPMAAVFASKGFNVVGLDLNHEFVDNLNSGRAPVIPWFLTSSFFLLLPPSSVVV